MTNLNDIIDTAAKAYARKHGRKEIGYYALNFEAGASFATTDPSILQAILQPFAEWCDNEYFTIQNPSIAVAKYIQFITDKSKEDEGHS